MEKEEQKWEQQLDLENIEEEESLKVRRSRSRKDDHPIASYAAAEDATQSNCTTNGHCETNGHTLEPSKSLTPNGSDYQSVLDNEEGREKKTQITEVEVEGHLKSDATNSVYYDKAQGIWKCRICCWTYGCASLSIDLIQNPNGHLHEPMVHKILNQRVPRFNLEIEENIEKSTRDDGSGFASQNFSGQKNLDSITDNKHKENQKDGTSYRSSEITSEEGGTIYKSSENREIEPADIDLINESDLEATELDVERVLQKQSTHDLYCPNCNSCITRRVILRKRKRQVRITNEDVKHKKLETIVDSKAGECSGVETGDRDHVRADIPPSATSELPANDCERDTEPDIFRCLSCFNIFIPTGNGFKLFRIFGDKRKKETVEDQQKSTMSKNWIPSFFALDKEKITVGAGNSIKADAEKTNSRAHLPSFSLNDQKGTAKYREDGDKVLPSPSQEQLMQEQVMLKAGANSNHALATRKDTGDAAVDDFEVAAGSQSNIHKDVLAHAQNDQSVAASINRIPVPFGEYPKDAIPAPQPDGLKLQISSNWSSTTSEKLQTDNKPDLAIQNKGADKESILSFPTTDSAIKEVDMNVNMNISVNIHHENELQVGAIVSSKPLDEKGIEYKQRTKDGETFSELPKIIEENKVDIQAGEHLKVAKDALVLSVKDASLFQDRGATKDFKKVSIAQSAGKDTVIVLEAGHVERAASQRVQDLNASAEIGTLPLLSTHVHVVEPMEAGAGESYGIDIVKSIVYGGLAESITSLGIVSSAAGGNTATLNIVALALANLIGGLVIVGHNLWDLKKDRVDEAPNQLTEQRDRYKELLGRRENFFLHATFVVLSFVAFGLIPPITYGFSFRKSDDRELKLVAAAAASLLSILVLAAGKAYVQNPPRSYLKTIVYYVLVGFMVSGVSYAVGELIKRILEKLHLFESNSFVLLPFPDIKPSASGSGWKSY